MIKIARRKYKAFDGGNGTVTKVVQVGRATHRGLSAMGSKFKKKDVVIQLSSHRASREVYYLTMDDLTDLVSRVADGRRFRWIRDARRIGKS